MNVLTVVNYLIVLFWTIQPNDAEAGHPKAGQPHV
jgi:hypothetical protein